MEITEYETKWFENWSWKTVGWATVLFLILACLTGLFTFLLDVLLFDIKFGYGYAYFILIFYTVALYFFYTKFKTNWLGVYAFGLCGIIGIPIELWLEFYSNPVLKGAWAAFAWGGIYILYGLAADLSLLLVKAIKNELVAIILSALIFSIAFLLLNILPLRLFYITGTAVEGTKDYLLDGYYLMPIAILEGIIGAIAGYYLANVIKRKKNC